MTKIEACIFDLDGVIVDTARYHYLAWREMAAELGFNFTIEDNERLKGVSRMRSLEIMLEVGGITLDEAHKLELAERKNRDYLSYIEKMTPNEILPGVIDFLNSVRSKGIKTAIGSASKNTPMILDKLQLTSYFDAIIDGNKVSEAKPNPEVFLKGAYELGVSPSNCIVFEDAAAGVEAALRGGMKCVGIGQPENLPGANLVVPGFDHFTLEMLHKV
ncbi:MAG TPA: beta-phosphoglucomutase [Prolixibacteraceae bacterium]|nr:beta-phosphoglucomutase [Prolixibacteraceae bacterium]HPS13405.1 beta-phosphoglucomutase [Prolixibacteraceae bacterium]